MINGDYSNINSTNRFITEPKKIKNDILYALISIYYYEQALLNNNKELAFNENKTYYFINPNWIIYFKNFYNYQMLSQILKILNEKNNGFITYYNFEQYIAQLKAYLSKNNFIFKNDEIPENLMSNRILAEIKKIDNISFYPYCYIIDIRIKNIIQNYVFGDNNLDINGRKVFAKDKFIYLSVQNVIMIGQFDQNFIFISHYILIFKPELFSNEQSLLSNYFFSFADYLKYRHIEKFISNKLPIKDEFNNTIGLFILVQKMQANNENKTPNHIKEQAMENNSNEQFSKIASNINSNNSLENNKNIKPLNNNQIDIFKKNISAINILPNINTSINDNFIKISQSLRPKEIISPNNKDFGLYGQSNLVNKDNSYIKMTPQNMQIREDGNQLKNDTKINQEFLYLKQKLVEKERELQNLGKVNNDLQIQLKQLSSKYTNEFNKLKTNLEKELNNRKEQLNQREILIFKKENEFNQNQNILNGLISKKNELIEKENKINEREKRVLSKENEIMNKEIEFNKKLNELIDKENKLNEREKIISNKEKENYKGNELYKLDGEYRIENNINEKENIISNKEEVIKNEKILTPIPPVEPEPISFYQQPTLIGLNNIGATCFMNSTLQCLSQTPDLTNYFLKVSKRGRIINNNLAKENKNSLQLSPIYLKLIQKLWDKNGAKSFSPNEFMNTIEQMNPLFKKGQAGDSKDFIIFILEQIHKELKTKINKKYNVDQPLNQYNRDNAFNYFFNDFTKDCSIISDAFFGFTETTNECLNCKKNYNSQYLKNPICYNYGIFNCLIFPLEEVKKFKSNMNYMNNMNNMNYMNNMNNMGYMNNMNNMGYMNNMNNMGYMNNMNNMNYMNNINQENSVTLDDCFLYNQKTDLFTGENKNYCNICRQLYDSYYTSKIYSCPNNLILILNRGKNNIYNIKLYFNEKIDITQYVVINDGSQWIYNLYGVITHIGESGPNAHFVASCKSPVDNKWYRYNDAFVNPINDFQKEIINFGTPYILFYQKNKNL